MRTEKSERELLKFQIDECLKFMDALERGFNEAVEDGLIDYYIYEKKAAEEKYRYLSGIYAGMTLR